MIIGRDHLRTTDINFLSGKWIDTQLADFHSCGNTPKRDQKHLTTTGQSKPNPRIFPDNARQSSYNVIEIILWYLNKFQFHIWIFVVTKLLDIPDLLRNHIIFVSEKITRSGMYFIITITFSIGSCEKNLTIAFVLSM